MAGVHIGGGFPKAPHEAVALLGGVRDTGLPIAIPEAVPVIVIPYMCINPRLTD